jgi:hypothetical protein
MRENGTRTVEISAPEPGMVGVDPNGLQPAVYVGASADGSKVFFVTKTELTADDKTHAIELYEYNTKAPEGERLVRVSRGESGEAEGKVDFVAGMSSDGSAVYFTASGQLTPGLPPLEEGHVYLYRYDTATKKTKYITQLEGVEYPESQSENPDVWYNNNNNSFSAVKEPGDSGERGLDALANWYVTADGRYLVFASYQDITGYDSRPANGLNCVNLHTTKRNCAEVYRYDAEADEKKESPIVCVSCGPPGVHEVDDALFARSPSGFAGTQRVPAAGPPRPISEVGSEEGSYVFFDTANALVPQAASGVNHVYEWHNGTISLISSAGDTSSAFFLGSSPSGSDVFFGTHAQLSPQDTDVSGDLYDARIDGGFVGLASPACTGTGCQGVPAAAPIFATPASVTFEGVGNFAASSGTTVKPKTKGLTRAQKLVKALKACGRDRSKHKRAICEKRARAQYGGAHRSTKAKRRGN